MKILIILGSVLIEVESILKTLKLNYNGFNYCIIEVSKKGLKVDYTLSNNFYKEELQKRKQANLIIKIWRYVSLFIPGINIILALISNHNLKKKYLNNLTIKNSFIPMNESEKEKVANTNSVFRKVGYTTYINQNEINKPMVLKRIKKI